MPRKKSIKSDITSEDQSSNEQSSTEQSSNEQSSNEQSSEEQSSNEQSSNEQSSNEQSSEEQSSKEQSSEEQSSKEQSSEDVTLYTIKTSKTHPKKEKLKYSCYYKILCDDKGTITTIYHGSDIHIPTGLTRFEEFMQSINNFYEKIKSQQGEEFNPNALIILTGDIMDQKRPTEPSIGLMFELFIKLNKLCTVLFIAGNHDCNMLATNTNDIFSTILLPYGRDINNVHYLQKTGVYRFKNILFCVTHVRDKTIFKVSDIDKNILNEVKVNYPKNNIIKISLYHGLVARARTHGNHKFTDADTPINVSDFDGYDCAMLGDIHMYQYLDIEKTVAYAGSLIQKDHGESINNHGFIKWSVQEPGKIVSEFIDVENEYAYHTIDMNTVKFNDIKSLKLSPKSRIRIIRKSLSVEELNEFEKELKNRHPNIIDIKIEPYVAPNSIVNTTITKNNEIIDVSSVQGIVLYGKKFLNTIVVSKKYKKKILNQLEEDISSLITEHSGKVFEILEVTYDNMFIFEGKNKIDFTLDAMNGKIIGIISKNHTGKSAILAIILYCLFDKCERGLEKDIINLSKDQFSCSFKFKIDDIIYRIQKMYSKKSNKKTKMSLSQYDEQSKQFIPLPECSSKKLINQKIYELVGSYHDFMTTTLCMQDQGDYKNKSIVKISPTDKTKFFGDMIGMNFLPVCKKKVKNDVAVIKAEYNDEVNKRDALLGKDTTKSLSKQINDHEKNISQLEEEIISITEKKEKEICPVFDSRLEEYDLKGPEYDTVKKVNTECEQLKQKISSHNNSDDISEKISDIKKKRKNLAYDGTLEEYNTECKKLNQKIISQNKKYDSESPSTIPDNEIEQLSKLKSKSSKNNNVIKKMIKENSEFDEPYNLDSEIDINNCTHKLRTIIAKRECALEENVYKETCDDLVDERDELLQQFKSANIPLSDIDIAVLKSKIKIKDSFKTICENDIAKLHKINKEYDNAKISEIIETKEKWIASYIKEKKKLESSIKNNCEDKVEYVEIEKRLEELHSEIHEIELNNGKYKKNKKVQYEIDNLNSDLEFLDTYAKLIKDNTDINIKISTMKDRHSKIIKNGEIAQELKKINKEKLKIEESIVDLEKQYKRYTRDIEKYESQLFDVTDLEKDLFIMEKYKKSLQLYLTTKKMNKIHDDEINEKTKIKYDMEANLKHLVRRKDKINTIQETINNLKPRYEWMELYLSMLDTNALPQFIIDAHLPIIVGSANTFLASFSDFELEYVSKKNKTAKRPHAKKKKNTAVDLSVSNNTIELFLKRKVVGKDGTITLVKPKLVNGSGYETFIANIALRFAFRNVSSSYRTNFFIIDEGWSCFDTDNATQIHGVLDALKKQYKHVIIISHLEQIKELIEYPLYITKTPSGFSNINNTIKK